MCLFTPGSNLFETGVYVIFTDFVGRWNGELFYGRLKRSASNVERRGDGKEMISSKAKSDGAIEGDRTRKILHESLTRNGSNLAIRGVLLMQDDSFVVSTSYPSGHGDKGLILTQYRGFASCFRLVEIEFPAMRSSQNEDECSASYSSFRVPLKVFLRSLLRCVVGYLGDSESFLSIDVNKAV
ncbi:hypothetical protein Tco_1165466 [Tanacetum coccineum]